MDEKLFAVALDFCWAKKLFHWLPFCEGEAFLKSFQKHTHTLLFQLVKYYFGVQEEAFNVFRCCYCTVMMKILTSLRRILVLLEDIPDGQDRQNNVFRHLFTRACKVHCGSARF